MDAVAVGPDVFISYRHADTREIVDRIYDYLSKHLGESRVFRDVEGIEKGMLISDRVNAALDTCKILLVVIGKDWVQKNDPENKLGLFDPNDYVLREITAAIKSGRQIITVIVHKADLPDKALLPEEIRPAFGRLAFEVRGNPYFLDDMKSLTRTVEAALLDCVSPRRAGIASAATEVRISGHSDIFFWWPVWALGFLLAFLTWMHDHRLAVVPPNTVVKHDAQGNRITLEIVGTDPTESLKIATNLAPDVDPFPRRIADNGSYGVLFATVLLLIVLFTNVRLQGLWSIIVILCMLIVAIVMSLLGEWDNIFKLSSKLKIHITGSGYLYFSIILCVFWSLAFFFYDRQAYVIFTPREVRTRSELGGLESRYSVFNMTVSKRRGDELRHWILGYGSGDVIIQTPGEEGQEFLFFNVLIVGKKLKELQEMYKDSPVKITN